MAKAPHKRKKKVGSYPFFTVVFSMTLSLFVIGLFASLFLHANKLSKVIKENIEMHIYLDNGLSKGQIDTLKQKLLALPYIDQKNEKAQIHFISKEAAAKQFVKETGEDFSVVLSENPLRASYVIKVNPLYFEEKQMEKIAAQIKSLNGVFEVDYPINLITEINKNIKTISLVLVIFAALLLIITIILINNTIRLALFSQRFLIRSMQLVGATRGFIQKPFLWNSLLHGFISGIIAVLILTTLLQYAYIQIEELEKLKELNNILIMFGGIILLGILIGFFSSYRAVKKYLNMSLDELY